MYDGIERKMETYIIGVFTILQTHQHPNEYSTYLLLETCFKVPYSGAARLLGHFVNAPPIILYF